MHAPTFIVLKQGHLGGAHGGQGPHGALAAHGPILVNQIPGGHGGSIGKAHAVAGPSYLVSTVHHVQKVSMGGELARAFNPRNTPSPVEYITMRSRSKSNQIAYDSLQENISEASMDTLIMRGLRMALTVTGKSS